MLTQAEAAANQPSLLNFIHDKDDIEVQVEQMRTADNLSLTDIGHLRGRVGNEFLSMITTLRQNNEGPNGDFRLKDLFHQVHVEISSYLFMLDDPDIMGNRTFRTRIFNNLYDYLRQVNRDAEALANVHHPLEAI